eukprot:15439012-Alexandrium_andersonii.AAC.1
MGLRTLGGPDCPGIPKILRGPKLWGWPLGVFHRSPRQYRIRRNATGDDTVLLDFAADKGEWQRLADEVLQNPHIVDPRVYEVGRFVFF